MIVSKLLLEIPPLRDRAGDIPLLIERFLNEIRSELNPNIDAIEDDAMQLLLSHRWPGNVRELRHVLERAAVLCSGSIIGRNDLALRGSSDLDRFQPAPLAPERRRAL